MTADEVAQKLRETPGSEAVLNVLLDLDVFTLESGKGKEMPYPVPMFGPDFLQEVIAAILRRVQQ